MTDTTKTPRGARFVVPGPLGEPLDLVKTYLEREKLSGRFLGFANLRRRRIFRLRFEINDQVRSFVAKRLRGADKGERSRLVLQDLLPTMGLSQVSPALLAETKVWHIYEDLGNWPAQGSRVALEYARASLQLVARVHSRFAQHPLLARCRASPVAVKWTAQDLSSHFDSLLRKATVALEEVDRSGSTLSLTGLSLRDRILKRLEKEIRQAPKRGQVLAALPGPETLLHGDLHFKNMAVIPGPIGLQARFIDWDYMGVGSYGWDVAYLLSRFRNRDRTLILKIYRESIQRPDWDWPSPRDWHALADTAYLRRWTRRIRWVAKGVRNGSHSFEALAKLELGLRDQTLGH